MPDEKLRFERFQGKALKDFQEQRAIRLADEIIIIGGSAAPPHPADVDFTPHRSFSDLEEFYSHLQEISRKADPTQSTQLRLTLSPSAAKRFLDTIDSIDLTYTKGEGLKFNLEPNVEVVLQMTENTEPATPEKYPAEEGWIKADFNGAEAYRRPLTPEEIEKFNQVPEASPIMRFLRTLFYTGKPKPP